MSYEYGQIILVPVADGRGNVEPHPAVIVSPKSPIPPGEKLRVVCVSTLLEDPCPTHHIPLPWQRPRHPKTGLNKPNVAKCNWLVGSIKVSSSRSWGLPRRAILQGSSRNSSTWKPDEIGSEAIGPSQEQWSDDCKGVADGGWRGDNRGNVRPSTTDRLAMADLLPGFTLEDPEPARQPLQAELSRRGPDDPDTRKQ